ncbi:ead/Ea22-like family protein [Salmonella enterica subsp. enterica]|nr:ead/Ea22-like family protein [Salmonella enterica subsp. enterica]
MSNIDKQALRISELEELNELLREKVKKTESDLWDKEQLRQVYSEKSLNLDSKVRELEARNQKDFVWRGREISRLNDEVDELKEKLEAAEKRIAEQREYYEGVIADGSKRIAELEHSETQLINERDYAESALNDAYKAVMGQAPEWSNWFSFENAIDEIELACELWRNQTDDAIQFRQRIQELESRVVNLPKRSVGEVMHMSGFSRDYAEGWCAGNDNAIHEIRTAGIKVKGE